MVMIMVLIIQLPIPDNQLWEKEPYCDPGDEADRELFVAEYHPLDLHVR